MKVFIGSSSEAKPQMTELAFWVEEAGHTPVRWDEPGTFKPGDHIFTRLREISSQVDAAIFIFSEDDRVWFRQDISAQPRDNILVEYGLFVGALGPKAAIICRKGQPKEPIDLRGIIFIDLDQKSAARIHIQDWLDGLSQPVHRLPSPTRKKAGILIDKAHQQGDWHTGSIFDLADDHLLPLRASLSDSVPGPLQIATLDYPSQYEGGTLGEWRGLIIGLPYKSKITQETRKRVVDWVRAGGRLALLGFELGDRHHGGNLNQLADEFGLRFNSDIVGPPGWVGKPYGVSVNYMDMAMPDHPLLANVLSLQLTNTCTLAPEPGIMPLVRVGVNSVFAANRESVRFQNGELQTPGGTFDLLECARSWPVVAMAHPGLCGQGEVVAIGTWELLPRYTSLPQNPSSLQFLKNLIGWLHG